MSKKTPDISKLKTSGFAILDVTVGRAKLAKHFADRPRLGKCPKALRVPIVIHGYIDDIHGNDDGTSQEFSVHVESIKTPEEK